MIDLRSDTVTRPSPAMRQIMARAPVGDDVYGEDPTINELQEKVARLLGKEKAIYVTSGCMGNQLSIKAHTQPGDEIIVEQESHIFNYETAAPAMISNVQLMTITGRHGIMTADQIERAIRSKEYYMPPTRLVCIENTHNRAGGTIYPIEEIRRIHDLVKSEGLLLHIDGARLWNACIATGISPQEYAQYCDSISVCFSKGLGAPVGSAVAGSEEFIGRVHRYRKIFGGGMRQAGIIAAGALYALEHNRERLAEDHEKARYFAAEVGTIAGFIIEMETVQTNIVIVDIKRDGLTPAVVLEKLRSEGVLLGAGSPGKIRAVTHLDVSMDEIRQAVAVFHMLFS
ncbi:MAG: low-specificity L-threonine aldolase [Bacteroidota bacterium]